MSELSMEEAQVKISNVIQNDPQMILYFKPRYITDEMWEYAIAMSPAIFPQCKHKTYRISAIAMSKDGFHIGNVDPTEYTGEQFQSLCEIAVTQEPKALALIPVEFCTDDMKAYAYSHDQELLMSEKKLTANMVEAILDHNPSLIQNVVDPTDDMIIKVLTKDPRAIVYFKHISPRVREFYEETYPQYAAMFVHGQ